jgi:hypothetical protein
VEVLTQEIQRLHEVEAVQFPDFTVQLRKQRRKKEFQWNTAGSGQEMQCSCNGRIADFHLQNGRSGPIPSIGIGTPSQWQIIRRSIVENTDLIRQKHDEISATDEGCGQLEAQLVEFARNLDVQKEKIQSGQREKENLSQEIAGQEGAMQNARSKWAKS